MTERTGVTIGGEVITVERVSGLKASRAFAILRTISDAIPELTKLWADYRTEYRRENFTELDRTQARLRFAPRPILHPDTLDPIRDEGGAIVYARSAIDHMTEEDWTKSGDRLRIPEDPELAQSVAAIFPRALDTAEESVYRLLALFTIRNEDVHRYWKDGGGPKIAEELDTRVDWLLGNAYADELLELAVVCGETIDDQFRRKVEGLGARVGKALRLVGLNPSSTPSAPTPPLTDSRPSSSTDGLESTDGPPTSPSELPSTSSSSSPASSTTNDTLSETPSEPTTIT